MMNKILLVLIIIVVICLYVAGIFLIEKRDRREQQIFEKKVDALVDELIKKAWHF